MIEKINFKTLVLCFVILINNTIISYGKESKYNYNIPIFGYEYLGTIRANGNNKDAVKMCVDNYEYIVITGTHAVSITQIMVYDENTKCVIPKKCYDD